jgi:hypothetical protein
MSDHYPLWEVLDRYDRNALPGGLKYCPRCGETKPRTEYHRDNNSCSGYRTHCKACRNLTARQRRAGAEPYPRNPPAKIPSNAPRIVKCSICRNTYDPSYFYADPNAKNGLQSTCKRCTKLYAKGSAIKRRAKRLRASGEIEDPAYNELILLAQYYQSRTINGLPVRYIDKNKRTYAPYPMPLPSLLLPPPFTAPVGTCLLCGILGLLGLYYNKTPYTTRYALPLCDTCRKIQETLHGDYRS